MSTYNVGDMVVGKITGIENYGIFLSFNNNYSGLLHISELSNKYVSDVNKYGKVGENINVKIIDVDEDKKQLKLSVKTICDKDDDKKINETGEGFKLLSDNLDCWIRNFYE